MQALDHQLGGWVRAQLFLCLLIGLITYLGLRLMGIDYALPLGILAGLLEIIPHIGPTVAAVPSVIAGLALSLPHGLAVAGLYFVIQQLENSVLVPRIMKQAVGVNPLITILALMIGFKLGGVGGAILAIPTFLMIQIIYKEVLSSTPFRKA